MARFAHCLFVPVIATLLWGLSVPDVAQASNPRSTSIRPFAVVKGTEVDVRINGDRLTDAQGLVIATQGIEVLSFEVPKDAKGKYVTAKLKISDKTAPGVHQIWVRTSTGLSELHVNLYVGDLPAIDEKEPNTQAAEAQPIEWNSAVHGKIDREDVDRFALEAKKGQRLSVEVEGLRLGTYHLGSNFFDPYVAVLNAQGFEIASCDDHAATRQDAFLNLTIPEDGTYTVLIRHSSYDGHGNCLYRMAVGDFARPSGMVPSGGKPGEKLAVKFLGDVTGEFTQEVTLGTDLGDFLFRPNDGKKVSQGAMNFRISPLENSVEQEPNNKREEASQGSAPGALNGVLSEPGDEDYFKVVLQKDRQYDFEVFGRRVRSSIDSVLYVYDAKGKQLQADDDRVRPDSKLRVKAPADGEYFVRVRDQLSQGGPSYHYRVEVTPVTPSLRLTTNEFTRYKLPLPAIPQGRRFAVLVSARRENFGGALKFAAENMPPGTRMVTSESWANDGVVPLMFIADWNAPLGSSMAVVNGTWSPKEGEVAAKAAVVQPHLRIRGRNQNDAVYRDQVSALPVTVCEETPFDVKIVTPKAPLVRGGTMKLKLVATKAEGWDEDITVVFLQNPPGVNASRSIKIKKGQTEAEIPLNASGNAPMRTSEIAVRSIARVSDGNIEICTPFAPLTVTDQYLKFNYQNTAVNQGEAIDYVINIDQLKEFEGTAQVELIGLPAKCTTSPATIDAKTESVTFKIQTDPKSPVGEHKNLFCRVILNVNGEPVTHQLGSGKLRINKPPVQPVKVVKKDTPKPKATAKPLSRLEMLRQQQAAVTGGSGE